MAMTLHRDKSRGAVPSVRDILRPYLGLSLEKAEEGRKNGRLGIAVYAMIARKHTLAEGNTEYEAAKLEAETLITSINAAVTEKAQAMLVAIDDPTDDDIAFAAAFVRNRNHKADYAQVDTHRDIMQGIVDENDDLALDAGETSLMGVSVKKSLFPAANSVYTIYNNYPRWQEMAFLTDSSRTIEGVYVANGEGWDKVDILTGVKVTSTRTMQQIHWVYSSSNGPKEIETLVGLTTVNGLTSETYDPFRGITCGQAPQVKDVVTVTAWKGVHGIE